MYVPSVPISSINILGQTIFNGELNRLSTSSVTLEERGTNFAAWIDMSASTTLIKVKTILFYVKYSHSAQLGVHEDDDEGRISLRDLNSASGPEYSLHVRKHGPWRGYITCTE